MFSSVFSDLFHPISSHLPLTLHLDIIRDTYESLVVPLVVGDEVDDLDFGRLYMLVIIG